MTRDDEALLNFEDAHPLECGAKEGAMRRQLGLTPVRYRLRLMGLVRRPEVVATYSTVVYRFERRLERPTAAHTSRTFG